MPSIAVLVGLAYGGYALGALAFGVAACRAAGGPTLPLRDDPRALLGRWR